MSTCPNPTLKFVTNALSALVMFLIPSLAFSETNWPRFQGVYLQMKNGDLVQLPSLRKHPTQDHRSFGRAMLRDLPVIQQDDIEAVVFSHDASANLFDSNGNIHVEWGFIVDGAKDPLNYCTRSCDGELVISDWSVKTKSFNVEVGERHSYSSPQFAMYERQAGSVFPLRRTGVTKGDDPLQIPIEAVVIKGAFGYAYWAFVPETD